MTAASSLVLVVDDDPSVCAAARRLLRSAGYQVRTFENTQEFFALGRPNGPCCMILDLRMPGEDGLAFQQRLSTAGIRMPIIFVSGYADVPSSVRAIKAGAIDFLVKPYQAIHLLAAVAKALEEDVRSLVVNRHQEQVRERYQGLTPREREVLAAVAAGLLNKQIAAQLGITEKTVKVHRARVMEKMHAEALADLVRMADSLGLHWNSPQNTAEYASLVV